MPRARLRELAVGALLHDIGKLSVPDEILKKPAALTDEEFTVVQSTLGAAGSFCESSAASATTCCASFTTTTSGSTGVDTRGLLRRGDRLRCPAPRRL